MKVYEMNLSTPNPNNAGHFLATQLGIPNYSVDANFRSGGWDVYKDVKSEDDEGTLAISLSQARLDFKNRPYFNVTFHNGIQISDQKAKDLETTAKEFDFDSIKDIE